MLIVQFAILIISLAVLAYFADKLIDSSAKLAKAIGISEVVIGITLLGYGTSLPEFAVSSIASLKNSAEISISNVVGSNIFNIAFIIGIASLISAFTIKEVNYKRDCTLLILTALFLILVIFAFNGISRIIGIFMVLFILIYTYEILRKDRKEGMAKKDKSVNKLKEIAVIIVSLIVVLISGYFTVESAVNIARELGISEWLIGATIIAVGTSFPELVVSITASKKGYFGMSVGNIVGSNIFNIMWILGFASLLNPLTMDFNSIKIDSVFLIAVSGLLAIDLAKGKITRFSGMIYLVIYVLYVVYLVNSGS